MKNVHEICVWVICGMVTVAACCGVWAETPGAEGGEMLKWNDACAGVWDSKWGGVEVTSLLEPKISELRKDAEQGEAAPYVHDATLWLRAALRTGVLPEGLEAHACAVKKHLAFTNETTLFPELCRQVARIGLAPNTWPNEDALDTGGIVFKWETPTYVIMAVDKATRLCVMLRDKRQKDDVAAPEARVKFLWKTLTEVFLDDVWKPGHVPATVAFWPTKSGDDVYDAMLLSSTPGDYKAKLNEHFGVMRLTLPPGPVVRAIFEKRLEPKEQIARKRMPESRFDPETLFENQRFEMAPVGPKQTSSPTGNK